jgi:inner membrane protein
MALFFGGAYLAAPELALAMAVGYFSHLVVDLLNKKPERLFWPVSRGQALGLCKAGGIVDGVLLVLGVATVAALLSGWL